MGGHRGRRIGQSHDGHPVEEHVLTGHRQLAIATGVRGQVDDDRTLRHPVDHRRGHQHWCLPPRDLRGGDHHVRRGHLGSQQLLLLGQVLGRLLPGVPTGAVLGLEVEFYEFGPQALYLFFRRRPHVVGADHRSEAPGGGDGLEAGHPRSHHQDLGRWDGARRGHEHGEELGQMLGRGQPGTVAGHRGL